MVDDKNMPPDLEENKKPSDEVTLDINAFDDEDIFDQGPAEAMDDFSLLDDDQVGEGHENDNTDAGLDIAVDITNSYEDNEQEKDLAIEQDIFDVGQEDEDLFAKSSTKLDDDELFADIFNTPADDDIFGDFKEPESFREVSPPPPTPSAPVRNEPIMMESTYGQDRDSLMDEEDTTFSSDAFDDVNADFPDSERSLDLGDDQLFDYDAAPGSTEDTALDDDIFAAPKGPSAKPHVQSSFAKMIEETIGKITGAIHSKDKAGAESAPLDQAAKTKRIVRTAALLILVVLVYSLLRFINPGTDSTVANNAATPDIDKIAKFDLNKAQPVQHEPSATTDVKISAPAESPAAEPMTTATQAPQSASTQTTIQVATTTTPAPVVEPVPAPAVSAPMPIASAAELSAEQKVTELEAALSAMDKKLAALNSQAQSTSSTNLALDSMNPNDASAAATKQILSQALQRIDELDKKLLMLAELQKEMKSLSNQLQTLKSDVVQQSMIVGQAQREINTGIQSFKLDNPEPVRIMVQAAIPGRAWLRSETGELYTVIPGDEVPGYGKVVSIDAGTGTVIMSSRAVIREQF